jgi:hypothetical protein
MLSEQEVTIYRRDEKARAMKSAAALAAGSREGYTGPTSILILTSYFFWSESKSFRVMGLPLWGWSAQSKPISDGIRHALSKSIVSFCGFHTKIFWYDPIRFTDAVCAKGILAKNELNLPMFGADFRFGESRARCGLGTSRDQVVVIMDCRY